MCCRGFEGTARRGDGELDTLAGTHSPGGRVDGDGHENSGALVRSSVTCDADANVSIY